MNRRHYRWIILLVVLAATSAGWGAESTYEFKDGKWVEVAQPAKGTVAGELELIRQALRRGKNGTAVRRAKRFLKDHPMDPSREAAMSLAGQAELNRGRYFQAYEWYRRQVDEYPAGPLLERALQREYDVADAFLQGRRRLLMGFLPVPATEDGLRILGRIVEQAPGSQVAERALLRMGDHYFDHRNYVEAIDAYDQFLQLYGRSSEQAPYAMLQAARATYETFRGVQYDDTPLLEARQRLRTFAEAYPQRAEQANVDRFVQAIHDIRAEKAYRTARFYDRIGRREASIHYHRIVVAEFSQTDWARRSRQALERRGRPVSPEAADADSMEAGS